MKKKERKKGSRRFTEIVYADLRRKRVAGLTKLFCDNLRFFHQRKSARKDSSVRKEKRKKERFAQICAEKE